MTCPFTEVTVGQPLAVSLSQRPAANTDTYQCVPEPRINRETMLTLHRLGGVR